MSEIASEIVVHGEDMDVDDSMNDTSMATSAVASPAEFSGNEDMAEPSPHRDILQTNRNSLESPMSHTSEQSELSSLLSSVSSKATTPVDLDAAREPALSSARYSQPRQVPRRTYDIEPKSSVPAGLDDITYAAECIRAVEASRLDPFSLHQGEYQLLRQHITHNQVTTYLNVRNGIVRLWYHNPRVPVTREQAIGCASVRWFDVASVCYDWLVRNGFINFGCVEFPTVDEEKEEEPPTTKQKTIVVIGGGMSGLGCARQLENLAKQYKDQFRELGELPPKVVVLEGRTRVGGRVYSRAFTTKPTLSVPGFPGERYTAEMGGMIITGFERGNPINVLLRGQLGLHYRALRPETTIYDSNGRPVDPLRDDLVEKLYNDCLDRVSEYKHHNQPSKLIRGNHDYIEHGRDSGTDGSKTIAESEEAAAALPHAAPVSQQNVPERVNRVPVSADKLTGRIHTEPGTPATSKASEKAKEMGWTLKNNITPEANIDLDDAAARPDATLGSVLDEAIGQYRNLVDLTAQDHRLINWHVANLEYSNATSLHNLSLGNWDIDAGNEWEGKHTMVAGGYQTVPRGLALCPTPLDLKTNAPVHKIKYSSEGGLKRSLVECEDGIVVEADYVVSTIPLGVLKQGSVDAMLGPIDIPSPLVLSKNSAVLKRKSPVEVYDPERARRDAHEAAVWDYIISTIGERPIPPGKVAANAYVLYNKAFFDEARKRCEKERSGKKKVSPNDVRVMTSKMWRAASAEERKPFEEDAVKAKAAHALAVQEYNDGSVRWDEAAINLRAEYEEEHDLAGSATLTADGKHRRTSKPVDYAEDDESVSE
ncbi:hypothetical protein BN1708_009167 [Verticillium longisporum]|uniref:HMG box domain-containing protein n=1 Tax=Verticillium longisporum TaxID=100787 RepID=A0A0G4KEI1_VERLO|nr:hypothetical protein BN1708_009167 [Verticillium longisporum]